MEGRVGRFDQAEAYANEAQKGPCDAFLMDICLLLAQTPYVKLITRAQALETGLSVADKETEIGTECLQLSVFSTQLGEAADDSMR